MLISKSKRSNLFVTLIAHLSKFINEHDELCLAVSLFPEPMLQFKNKVLVNEFFSNYQEPHFTCQGDRFVVSRVSFISF